MSENNKRGERIMAVPLFSPHHFNVAICINAVIFFVAVLYILLCTVIFLTCLRVMFHSGDKQNKSLAQVLREKNSRNRFVSELTKSEDQIFNRSLDSAQNSLSERKPNMKQTKLLIRRSVKRPIDRQTDCFTTLDQMETKTELFIIPSPKKRILESKVKLNNTVGGYEHIIERPTCSMGNNKRQGENVRDTTKTQDLMAQSGRNMLMLVGKVDYVLKISKMYPKLNILWDVYGKLQKISKGKIHYEYILLLRNSEGDGPVLQCVYFDFDNTLNSFKNDSIVRVVGHINGYNRLRVFKLQLLENSHKQTSFMRIQNINSFILSQNHTSSKD